MSAVLSDEWEAFYDLGSDAVASLSQKVSAEQAYEVSSRAMDALQERIDAVHDVLIEYERDRRKKFKTSWIGKILPFLAKDPEAPISVPSVLREDTRRWFEDISELRVLEHYVQRCRSLVLQAQESQDFVEVATLDWSYLCQAAGFSQT